MTERERYRVPAGRQVIRDSLMNLVSGMGTSKDQTISTLWYFEELSAPQIDAAYRSDWLARKIIDLVPYDMTREWRSWQADRAKIELLENAEKKLNIRGKVSTTMSLARKYGGAALFIGDGAPDPSVELKPDSIRKDGIKYLHVLTRYELGYGQLISDPLSPFFGQPEYYEINSDRGRVKIHPSRLVIFVGVPRNEQFVSKMDPWGDSVLQSVQDAIKAANGTHQGISALVHEAKIDVISIPNLSSLIATNETTDRLTSRFAYANTMKSMFNMLLLGDSETWTRKEASFADLPEVARLFMQFAAGAADIPVTRLLGQSPDGLNATGESDIRNYYDMIAARQKTDLMPALTILDEVLIRHALGTYPPDLWYKFNPLWQQTPKERAETNKLEAETIQVIANAAILNEEALAKAAQNLLVERGVFPGLEEAIASSPKDLPEEPQVSGALPNQKGSAADAAPRSMYVRRDVVNVADIERWASAQGLNADDGLHVTIAYSKEPVDWMQMGESSPEIKIVGGPRLVERLGPKNSIVLLFTSDMLRWRHADMQAMGASWDFPDYQPHITIMFEGQESLNLDEVEPYQGMIVLGPEIFEEVK